MPGSKVIVVQNELAEVRSSTSWLKTVNHDSEMLKAAWLA